MYLLNILLYKNIFIFASKKFLYLQFVIYINKIMLYLYYKEKVLTIQFAINYLYLKLL